MPPIAWTHGLNVALAITLVCAQQSAAAPLQFAQTEAEIPLTDLKPPVTTFGEPGVVDFTAEQKTYVKPTEGSAAAQTTATNRSVDDSPAYRNASALLAFVLALCFGIELGSGVAPNRRTFMIALAVALGGFAVAPAMLAGGTGDSYPAGVASFTAVAIAAAAAIAAMLVIGRFSSISERQSAEEAP